MAAKEIFYREQYNTLLRFFTVIFVCDIDKLISGLHIFLK